MRNNSSLIIMKHYILFLPKMFQHFTRLKKAIHFKVVSQLIKVNFIFFCLKAKVHKAFIIAIIIYALRRVWF